MESGVTSSILVVADAGIDEDGAGVAAQHVGVEAQQAVRQRGIGEAGSQPLRFGCNGFRCGVGQEVSKSERHRRQLDDRIDADRTDVQ
ncbi:MAG: hypothetical protein EBY97_06395 [Burkholderiaceae bacterium]|nr:hypothetical protein [Burkholderiaceae bacterium]